MALVTIWELPAVLQVYVLSVMAISLPPFPLSLSVVVEIEEVETSTFSAGELTCT